MKSPATSHATNSKSFKKTPPVPEEMFLLHLLPFSVRHHVALKAQGDQERWEHRFFLTFTSICKGEWWTRSHPHISRETLLFKQQVVIIPASSLSSASLILEASTVIAFLSQDFRFFSNTAGYWFSGSPLCLGSLFCLFCCNSSNLPPARSAL